MTNARWLSCTVLGLALVANSCSSDSDGGVGASGGAGEAGAPDDSGGSFSEGGSDEVGEAGVAGANSESVGGGDMNTESQDGNAGALPESGGSGGSDGSVPVAGAGGKLVTADCSPSGTAFEVTTKGLKYVIDGQIDPDLVLCRGNNYSFVLKSIAGHPFYIKTVDDSTGTGDAYIKGVTGNGYTRDSMIFDVPTDAPATLYYHCSNHAGMGGKITVLNKPAM